MLICESCRAKTTTLFNCYCRQLICQQCKEERHREHVKAMAATTQLPGAQQ